MRITLKVTIDVDADEWASEYGCEKSEVRDDVKAYFQQHLGASAAVEDAGLTVRVA